MAKFTLECPYCGALNRASTFVLARKEIICGNCKSTVNVRTNRMTSRKCPHCGNIFVYDQAKSKNRCPACHKSVTIGQGKIIEFPCPQCSCIMQIDKNAPAATCPVCDYRVEDVQQEYEKSKLVNDNSISVIKYEGDNNTFVWKHPIEDFNLGSQLIVHNSQEAVFFLSGKAMDTFGEGRHTLETENLPILKRANVLPTNKQNPFHAEVYFINKTVQMGIKWGTDSRVRFIDPLTSVPLNIGASGEFSLMVSDSRRLLAKIVGTTGGLTRSQIINASAAGGNDSGAKAPHGWSSLMQGLFRPVMMVRIKTFLAKTIKEENIDILEIDEQMEKLSDSLCKKIAPDFEEYGLSLVQFFVTNVSLPEDDESFKRLCKLRSVPYLATKEAEAQVRITESQRMVMEAQKETDIERTSLEAKQKAIEQGTEIELKKQRELADVEVERQRGLAEAEIMRGKGYSQRDVIEGEVQKAYAESLGQFGKNGGGIPIPGTGGGSGMVNDIVGLGVGFGAAGAVSKQMSKVLDNLNSQTDAPDHKREPEDSGWKCSCGQAGNHGDFCSKCGSPKPVPWDCPSCGSKGNISKCCPECGQPKPVPWDCPSCGKKGIISKCCPDCGARGSQTPKAWVCPNCGKRGLTSKCCPECGTKRPEKDSVWDCDCGARGITSRFCPDCGAKRKDGES